MIKIKIKNPPLGISENQTFETKESFADFIWENRFNLPNAKLEDGVLIYDRTVYESSDLETIASINKRIMEIKKSGEVFIERESVCYRIMNFFMRIFKKR